MIEFLVLFLVIIAFIIASIEDIKKREVYDYINYSLAFLVIAISIFHSFLINSIEPFKYVGFGLLVGFALGSVLYYIGIWGGGDAKFLIGFSASSYYLLNFINTSDKIYLVYTNLIEALSYIFDLLLNYFLEYIIILDIIFLTIIVIRAIRPKDRKEFEAQLTLFLILFLLFIGLYFNYSNFILVVIGFFSFLLIFFGNDYSFHSIYFKIKKRVSNLKESDYIYEDILEKDKLIISYEDAKDGLSKEHLFKIEEAVQSDKHIYVKKILPLSILVVLNYIMYLFKIISLDKVNLDIIGFMFKFLFFSFFAGSIIAVLILFGYFVINHKKVKVKFKLYEKIVIYSYIILLLLLFIYNSNFINYIIVLFSLLLVYIFIKFALKIEGSMFVKKKSIDKITLGDWIAQDIKVDNKLIYSQEDFKLGINEKQLERLRILSKKHIELTQIYVKDGLAFIPALFIGFIILLLI